ncbi:hypothetical protein GW17_00041538 [Ensete ventricosum]|nr:hypothetical protein GW17_00041538 [Ensete ventricosum]
MKGTMTAAVEDVVDAAAEAVVVGRQRGRRLLCCRLTAIIEYVLLLLTRVNNVVSSLTSIIQDYNLDGIDIDYEHFQADAYTFAECIGQLLMILENNGLISFASIAPFDDAQVQSHYQAVWSRYSNVNRPCQLPVLRVRFEHSGVAVLELLPDS